MFLKDAMKSNTIQVNLIFQNVFNFYVKGNYTARQQSIG